MRGGEISGGLEGNPREKGEKKRKEVTENMKQSSKATFTERKADDLVQANKKK